jgi:hypothetical protein
MAWYGLRFVPSSVWSTSGVAVEEGANDGLIIGGLRGALAHADTALHRATTAEHSPARLLEAGVAYVAFARRRPGHFRAMFHPRLGPRLAGGELEQASTRALGVLVDTMRAAQAAGVVREGDALELSLAAWSLVHGLAALAVDDHLAHKGLGHEPEALARTLGLHLYFGVRTS